MTKLRLPWLSDEVGGCGIILMFRANQATEQWDCEYIEGSNDWISHQHTHTHTKTPFPVFCLLFPTEPTCESNKRMKAKGEAWLEL